MLEFSLLKIEVFSPPFMCKQNVFIHSIIRTSIIFIIEHIQDFPFFKTNFYKKNIVYSKLFCKGSIFFNNKKKRTKPHLYFLL